MQRMSHRDRIRNMKIENYMDIKNFRAIIRGSAEKNNWTYYVVLHIIKRARFVRDGVVKIVEKDGIAVPTPQILMSVDVIESNLPMPINVYNPIFKFIRNDKDNPLDPKKASYYGIPTAFEYFTLPENVENTLNHREPVGEYFTSAGILKWFDTMSQADMFLVMLADQIKVLLDDLQVFVEKNKVYFDWEAVESIGITRLDIKRATIAKEYGVSSLLAPDIDNPDQKG